MSAKSRIQEFPFYGSASRSQRFVSGKVMFEVDGSTGLMLGCLSV